MSTADQKSSLDAKYSKWDNFKDDSDDEEREQRTATTFDVGQDVDIKKLAEGTKVLLDDATIAKLRRYDRVKREIWQVVTRELRVWVASSDTPGNVGDDAVPCRPHCLLLCNVYPKGKLLKHDISSPPERPPSPEQIMKNIVEAIEDPSDGAARHRPEQVVFVDTAMAGQLHKTLSALGILASALSEPNGVDEYVRGISDGMVKRDLATRGSDCDRPGTLSGTGVTPRLAGGLWAGAAACLDLPERRRPWDIIFERQSFQIRVDEPGEMRTLYDKDMTGARASRKAPGGISYCSTGRSGGKEGPSAGVYTFFSRLDLESRLVPPERRAQDGSLEIWRVGLVASCCVLLRLVASCCVLCCLVSSCLAMPCRAVPPRRVCHPFLFCSVLSYPIISRPGLSYSIPSLPI